MDCHKQISSLSAGDNVEGFYLLKSANQKSTTTGKPFLNAVLADVSGSIPANVWDYSGPISAKDNGKIVKIRGNVTEYRGALQLSISKIRIAETLDTYDLSEIVPVASKNVASMIEEIEYFIHSIKDKDYRDICSVMFSNHRKALETLPAAKSVHHSSISGLLMHTSTMLYIADFLAGVYEDFIDRSLLLAGTFLHDLGKEAEFNVSPLGLVTDYSVKGQLIGHLVLCAQEVATVAAELKVPEEKSILLQHMILSHHGEPEFGAAVKPLCAESELLSRIDMLDSRMEIYRDNLSGIGVGEMSGTIFGLDKKIYKPHEIKER